MWIRGSFTVQPKSGTYPEYITCVLVPDTNKKKKKYLSSLVILVKRCRITEVDIKRFFIVVLFRSQINLRIKPVLFLLFLANSLSIKYFVTNDTTSRGSRYLLISPFYIILSKKSETFKERTKVGEITSTRGIKEGRYGRRWSPLKNTVRKLYLRNDTRSHLRFSTNVTFDGPPGKGGVSGTQELNGVTDEPENKSFIGENGIVKEHAHQSSHPTHPSRLPNPVKPISFFPSFLSKFWEPCSVSLSSSIVFEGNYNEPTFNRTQPWSCYRVETRGLSVS